MGIEPFLLILIIAGMFFLQAGRALSERLWDRIAFSLATRQGVRQLADRAQMQPDRGEGSWRVHDAAHDLQIELCADRYPARRIRRRLSEATGVWQRSLRAEIDWLAPSTLVLVRLPEPVVERALISQRPSVVPKVCKIALHNPVLDQLLRVQSTEPARVAALLADGDVHEPLIELLGRHPLSVVTEQVVALWCVKAVADPQPLVDLALEVAIALRRASLRHARPQEDNAPELA